MVPAAKIAFGDAMDPRVQCSHIAEDVARRISTDGLEAVIATFREQGLSVDSIDRVLTENDIFDPANVTLSGAMAFKLACEILAAEQQELHHPQDAASYLSLTEGYPKTFECI